MERPYRVWLYPFTVFLIIAIMIGLTINSIVNEPLNTALGVIVPIIGWVLYNLFIQKNVERVEAERETGEDANA